MKPRRAYQPKRKYRRDMTPMVEVATEIRLDPITGIMLNRGEGGTTLARQRANSDQRFQFWAQPPLDRRIRSYVAETPGLTISQFLQSAAQAYLESKGK